MHFASYWPCVSTEIRNVEMDASLAFVARCGKIGDV
jgi:hypothetical protein